MVDLIEAGLWSNDSHLHGGDSACVCVCVSVHAQLWTALVAVCASETEKGWTSEKTEKSEKQRVARNSVILSIFEVGFEGVTEALGILHKLFLLLFQHLANKHRRPFSSIHPTFFMCVFTLLHVSAYPSILMLVSPEDGVNCVEQLLDGAGDVSVGDIHIINY